MISKVATTKFLARKLRDSNRAKEFSRKALLRKVKRLRPKVCFHTKPRTHQLVSFLLGVKHPRYMMLLDMGLGKTKVILDLFAYWVDAGKLKCGLVLVPNTSNIQAWRDEAAIHAPHLRVVGLDGDQEEKVEALDSGAHVVVMTYMAFLMYVCAPIKRGKSRGKKDDEEKGMKIDPKRARAFCKRFQGFALDECTFIKNSQSKTFRALRHLKKTCDIRYGMTGTPFGRDPSDLWAQFFIIDDGETLGPTLGLFRGAFFREEEDPWSGFPRHVFEKKNKKLLHRMLRHNSIRYRIEECEDMPPRVPSTRYVFFPEDIYAYYKRMVKRHHKAEGDKEELDSTFMQMRQLCSGFLVLKDADGNRQEIVFDENPKLEALVQWISEVPPNRKMLIFHVFKRSGAIISDRLKQLGIKHGRLYGGTPKRQKATLQVKFREDPELRVLVCSEAAAFGLNLQVGNYEFFYEPPVSPIRRDQMERRCWRTGQTRTTFINNVVVRGSVEERINEFVSEGRDLRDAIVEGETRL